MSDFKPSDPRLTFAIIAVENAALRMAISPAEVYGRLEKLGLTRAILFDTYDMLHTQSKEYVGEYVADAIRNREKQQEN